jgi:ribulose-5-phosphate 4-epimerase/fuculose-1-phosphate aldolase
VAVITEILRPELLPELSPQAEIALLARILYREGYDDYTSGHITYRQADDTFLALPLEYGWNEVTASDVIRIDVDGNLLEGKWTVPPAIGIHLEYHRAKPNAIVTLHQHPRYSTPWSTAGRLPPVYDQRSAFLPDSEYVLYDDYEGLFEEDEAVRSAVEAIGDAKCTLLRNHGVFVVAGSIQQALTNATTLEWRCRQAWMVEVLGGGGPVPDVGRTSIDSTIRARGGVSPLLWEWAVRRELGELRNVLD